MSASVVSIVAALHYRFQSALLAGCMLSLAPLIADFFLSDETNAKIPILKEMGKMVVTGRMVA